MEGRAVAKSNNKQEDDMTKKQEGGSVAKAARTQLESKLGRSIISKSKSRDYLLPPEEKKGID